MKEKALNIADSTPHVSKGTAAMPTFIGAQPATVSALAMASGGIGKGRLVDTHT